MSLNKDYTKQLNETSLENAQAYQLAAPEERNLVLNQPKDCLTVHKPSLSMLIMNCRLLMRSN
jgi:hypothetical protein